MALDVGKSTGRSTVESGAATMKIMRRTRTTSINGVTLISWVSPKSSSSSTSVNVTPIVLLRRAAYRPRAHAVEIARQLPRDRATRPSHQIEVAFRDAREMVVDH